MPLDSGLKIYNLNIILLKEKDMENTPSVATEEQPAKTGTSKTFASVVFFLFIILNISIGALWQQLMQSRQEINKTQKNLAVLLADQKISQEKIKSDTALLSQKLDSQQNMFSQMNTQVSALMKRAPGDDRSWKTAEILYLVRMANLELDVQHNIPATLVLLKQAENQLNTLQDASLDNFHAALLKNISVLQNTPIFDIDALTTQLSNLRDEVSSLSILVAPKPNTSILENTPRQSHKNWWQRAWDNIKASLQQLVIVRHQDEKIPALMSPEEQLYLQENLKLLLIQAQWALLNHDTVIYEKSLKQAKSWVEKYYVQNSASTQNFLKQLAPLMRENISPPVPDLAQTLSLVHA
jgi:uroporphyrin-3 C-methyltransferase